MAGGAVSAIAALKGFWQAVVERSKRLEPAGTIFVAVVQTPLPVANDSDFIIFSNCFLCVFYLFLTQSTPFASNGYQSHTFQGKLDRICYRSTRQLGLKRQASTAGMVTSMNRGALESGLVLGCQFKIRLNWHEATVP